MDSDCIDAAALCSRYGVPSQLCVWAKVAFSVGPREIFSFSIHPSITTSIHNITRLCATVTIRICVYGITVNISCIYSRRGATRKRTKDIAQWVIYYVFLGFGTSYVCRGVHCCSAYIFQLGRGLLLGCMLWFSTYMRLHQEYMNNVCGGAKGNDTPLYTTVKRCG